MAFGAIWLLCWIVPWGKVPTIQAGNLLAFITEMPRLGFALLLVMIPGMLLYLLLNPKDEKMKSRWGMIPIGLAFSTTHISLIGLLGRLFGWSFVLVKAIFCVVGLIEIFLVAKKYPDFRIEPKRWFMQSRAALNNPPLVLALALGTLMTVHAYLFFIDDTTYLAYLTNWQHSTQLGFDNLVHEIQTIENSRFWLALFPMHQAMLADLSGLPGLLLFGNYLELLLIPFAILTNYWFAQELDLNQRKAGFAVLFQITLISWMLGDELPLGVWFFQNLSEDKVFAVFIIAPVFFTFGLDYIQNRKHSQTSLLFFSGLSLTLAHPIILFYSICILLSMALIAILLKESDWKKLFLLLSISFTLMAPYLAIRIFDSRNNILVDAVSVTESHNFDIFVRVVDDVFYGLNPGMLKFLNIDFVGSQGSFIYQIFRLTPIILIILGLLFALGNIKKGRLNLYVFSSGLLILLATVPYTGWLVGYIVSARMLSRASWFLPLGFSAVLLLSTQNDWFKKLNWFQNPISLWKEKGGSTSFWGIVICLLFVSPILLITIIPNIPSYFDNLNYYKQLSDIGAYIDENTEAPVMAIGLEYLDTQFLPGVSTNVRLISFREQNVNPQGFFMSADEIDERINASKVIRSTDQTYPAEESCFWMEKYNLQFVLAQQEKAQNFVNHAGNCMDSIDRVYETEDLVLLEINGD